MRGAARGNGAKLNLAKSSQLNRAEVDKVLRAGGEIGKGPLGWQRSGCRRAARSAARRLGERMRRDLIRRPGRAKRAKGSVARGAMEWRTEGSQSSTTLDCGPGDEDSARWRERHGSAPASDRRLDHASLTGCELNRPVNVDAPAPARPQDRKLLLARRPAAGARGLDARRPRPPWPRRRPRNSAVFRKRR